ncbi:hypothetical protein KC19_VG154400 [Ceratodon purpureus]|uniref:Uncharacterized protein n=1 Tax=Ceratodon purpureus TaxID=3225 RepID=A0A8T0HQU9_CERPU|nr:hypothetical protein KC19_VG154400 [Ceratodon purpureus]
MDISIGNAADPQQTRSTRSIPVVAPVITPDVNVNRTCAVETPPSNELDPEQRSTSRSVPVLTPVSTQGVHITQTLAEEIPPSHKAEPEQILEKSPTLVLRAMAKLADKIMAAAGEGKDLFNAEGNKCLHDHRKASLRLQTSKNRLESLQIKLSYSEVKLVELKKQQSRAFSFRNNAMARIWKGKQPKPEEDGPPLVYTEADICEDAMHAVTGTTAFSESRVARLMENARVRKDIVATIEENSRTKQVEAKSRAKVLKGKFSELQGLLHFLRHPEFLIKA